MNNTPSWLTTFKAYVAAESQPWIFAALRQDAGVWQALHTHSMQQKLAERAAHIPQGTEGESAAWSPASLALLALTSGQELAPTPPFPPALSQQAIQSYRNLRSQTGSPAQVPPAAHVSPAAHVPPTLSQAGLAALAICEQYHESASWAETIGLLNTAVLSSWQTALACLYGWLPATRELIQLLVHANPARYTALALHVLLSNPIPLSELVETLDGLFNTHQDPATTAARRLAVLEQLEAQRPMAAAALSRRWLAAFPGQPDPSAAGQPWAIGQPWSPLANRLENLAQSLLDNEIQRLAQPSQASLASPASQPSLDQALEGTLDLHADLYAHWASHSSNIPSIEPTTGQRAALAAALLNAGRYPEAAATMPEDAAETHHPGLLLAHARLAYHTGDVTQAQAAAGRLAEIVFTPPAQPGSHHTPWLPNKKTAQAMSELFSALQMFPQAVQAAQWALQSYPNETAILAILAQAQRADGQTQKACQALQAAICLEPGDLSLHRQLAESLE